MAELLLRARTRTVEGKKTKALRRNGVLPAVVYGHGQQNRNLELNRGEFIKVYKTSGESTLVDLLVDDSRPTKVLIQDVQFHPTSGQVLHADLHQVKMTEKVHTEIPLAFRGESPAVKELGGVLVKNINALKVEALPGDLVPELVVDISALKTFDDTIHVRDVPRPSGVSILDVPDEVVAVVSPPRSEAELSALQGEVKEDVSAVEKIEKEKEEQQEEEGHAQQTEAPAAGKE